MSFPLSYNLSNYNPLDDLNQKYDNIIHLFKQNTNGRKCITIIKGFDLDSEKEKKFLKLSKQKLSTNGFKKLIPEFGSVEVFCFNGDKREDIKKFIMEEYNKTEDCFVIHG